MEITKDAISRYLLSHRYLLTALEFQQELLTEGTSDGVLREFFGNAANFPGDYPADIWIDSSEDVARKASVLEHELRIAREDIAELQHKLRDRSASVVSAATTATTGSADAAPSADEQHTLDVLIRQYLLSQGYSMTAISFSDEAQDLDDASGLAPSVHLVHCLRALTNPGSAVRQEEDKSQTTLKSLEDKLATLTKDIAMLQTKRESHRKKRAAWKASVANLQHTNDQTVAQLHQSETEVQSLRIQLVELQQQKPANVAVTTAKAPAAAMPTAAPLKPADTVTMQRLQTDSDGEPPPKRPDVKQRYLHEPLASHAERGSTLLTDEGDRMVRAIADALPKVIPHVLLNNREELLPMFVAAIRAHPDRNVRTSLLELMFALNKKPTPQQRAALADALKELSNAIGADRTEQEILPEIGAQFQDKYIEKRLFALDAAAAVSAVLTNSVRGHTVLGYCDSLVSDINASVRERAVRMLGEVLPHFEDDTYYTKTLGLVLLLLRDPEPSVVDTAIGVIVGPLFDHSARFHQLIEGLLQTLMNYIQDAASVRQDPSGDGGAETRLIAVLSKTLTALVPRLFQVISAERPIGRKEYDTELAQQDRITAFVRENESLSSWPTLDWFVNKLIAPVVRVAAEVELNFKDAFRSLVLLLREICKVFGRFFAEHIVLPFVEKRMSDCEDADNADGRIRQGRLLSLEVCGILGTLDHERTFQLLRELIVRVAMQEYGFTAAHSRVLEDAVRILAKDHGLQEVVLRMLSELVSHPSSIVRSHCAKVMSNLTDVSGPQLIARRIVPALLSFGADDDKSVRLKCVDACGTVCLCVEDAETLGKIRTQFEKFLDEHSQDMTIAVVMTFANILLDCPRSFRDEFILPKIMQLAHASSDSTDKVYKADMTRALMEAYRAISALQNIPNDVTVQYVLPGIAQVLKDSQDLLDSSYISMIQAMQKDIISRLPAQLQPQPEKPKKKGFDFQFTLPKFGRDQKK
eukprot:TRINITY_DN6038_c0_g1_i1.p1 TRINITY_DN6038_c0_g1~~TRINITY_DN6038_c0_g1_i1.p1  ORF type:complete len:981 (+),score=268.08 TRINITY_DN6038_c0_g1_i1:1089-4031(+)